MLNTLNDNSEKYPVKMYFLDNVETKYQDYKDKVNTAFYSNILGDAEKIISEMHGILKERQERFIAFYN